MRARQRRRQKPLESVNAACCKHFLMKSAFFRVQAQHASVFRFAGQAALFFGIGAGLTPTRSGAEGLAGV